MKVLVTGATGLVGTALVKSLAHDGHLVCRLLRRESVTGAKGARPKSAKKAEAATAAGLEGRVFDVAWDPEASAAHAIGDPQGHTVGADAVVNLAGASIADGKWTTQRKMQLRSSRIKTTRSLLTALQKAGLSLDYIDLIEVNEAFAAQYLAVEKELGLDREKVNVNGGAIALGHPLGATGTRLVITLLYELRRRKKKYGLATACIGGGQGIAMVVESMS